MNVIGRKLAENYCNFLEKRIQSLQAESATQRYQKLLISEPDVIKRVPVKFIASYIGISSETLRFYCRSSLPLQEYPLFYMLVPWF